MEIDSNWSKLHKTVGLLTVRLDLDKLRLKNPYKMNIFYQNLNPKKNRTTPLQKMKKFVKK